MADTTIVEPTTCAECGQMTTGMPLDWMRDVDTTTSQKRVRYFCPTCSRAHLRAIEAGLDRAFW